MVDFLLKWHDANSVERMYLLSDDEHLDTRIHDPNEDKYHSHRKK